MVFPHSQVSFVDKVLEEIHLGLFCNASSGLLFTFLLCQVTKSVKSGSKLVECGRSATR